MDPNWLVEYGWLLMVVAVASGWIDAIAGGGGMLTIPALLATGMSPQQALATNKLQASFGSGTATYLYIRHGLVKVSNLWPAIVATAVGAIGGSYAVQQLDAGFLSLIIPWLLIAIALYYGLAPRVDDEDRQPLASVTLLSSGIGALVGAYDGFFGPGTGAFMATAFVLLCGFGLSKATAHAKILNFTSNIAALLAFIVGGQVLWSVGLLMAVGQWFGARLGARLVINKGARWIRPVIMLVAIAVALKLLING